MSLDFSTIKWSWAVISTIVAIVVAIALSLAVQFGYGLIVGFQLRGAPPQEMLMEAFASTPFLVLGVVVSLVMATPLLAQAKKDPESGFYRIEGAVQAVEKDKMQILVKEASSANVIWSVSYNDETSFTEDNEESTLEAVETGQQVVVLGEFDDPENQKTKMKAVRVDIRR